MICRAVVTGATGYIGSCIVKKLIDLGVTVGIICRKNSNMQLLSNVQENISICVFDGKIENMVTYLKKFRPEVVFHMASFFVAEHNSNDIRELIDSNVLFGTQLLEAMRMSDVHLIINASTAWQHYNNEEYDPVSLYAASKEAFEIILKYYTAVENFEAISLAIFDSYGPGDPRKKIIHLLQKIAGTRETLEMSGGEQLLDMVFIDDVVSDFLCAADMLVKGEKHLEKYYIRSGKLVSLRELVGVFEKVYGVKLNIIWGARPYRRREVMHPATRGMSICPIKKRVSLEEGLRRIKENDI